MAFIVYSEHDGSYLQRHLTFFGAIRWYKEMKKINIDPAVASGPVIATVIDVLGLTVYFILATVFLVEIL